jgi:hypothetical protein
VAFILWLLVEEEERIVALDVLQLQPVDWLLDLFLVELG